MVVNSRKQLQKHVTLFAALGDETRIQLLWKLRSGGFVSITRLSDGQSQTRQAIRKHLGVLENAKLIRSIQRGREHLFRIELRAITSAAQSLQAMSQQWDDALNRLKSFVEK